MRKLLGACLGLLVAVAPAKADELTAWKKGFEAGAQAGYQVCKVEVREKLKKYEDLVQSVFNTKALIFAGKFPLPTAVQKVEVVRKPDGTAEIVRKWEVLPPAYFPLDAVESLKGELTGGVRKIPAGWGIVLNTKNLPIEKITYAYYSAKQSGLNPVYLPQDDLLVLGVFSRKADAEDEAGKLRAYGVQAVVQKIKEPIELKEYSLPLTEELQKIAEALIKKEKLLLSMGEVNKSPTINTLADVLDRAIAVARNLEGNPAYRDFDFVALEKDISAIKHNLLAYLYQKEPYKRVVLYDPFEKEREGYESRIKELESLVAKLKAENERLKKSCSPSESVSDKNSKTIIDKYLRGEL